MDWASTRPARGRSAGAMYEAWVVFSRSGVPWIEPRCTVRSVVPLASGGSRIIMPNVLEDVYCAGRGHVVAA